MWVVNPGKFVIVITKKSAPKMLSNSSVAGTELRWRSEFHFWETRQLPTEATLDACCAISNVHCVLVTHTDVSIVLVVQVDATELRGAHCFRLML